MTPASRKSMISQFFEKENEPEEMEVHKTTISTENELNFSEAVKYVGIFQQLFFWNFISQSLSVRNMNPIFK